MTAAGKTKTHWVCTECGHAETKWAGNCYACKSWNTLKKFTETAEKTSRLSKTKDSKAILIQDIEASPLQRMQTGYTEIDRLMGGGIVSGSLTLLGGDPGVGKSTLMLMLSDIFCKLGKKVLYVCGEESLQQTSLRAKRLGISSNQLYLLSETHFPSIEIQLEELKPDIFILDSIQIVYSGDGIPGSVSQVKEIAMQCMQIAKQTNITTFLIGHVTKSGDIAGPRVLEHIVDSVLDFEGDREQGIRILRSCKNRFGPTDEMAMFHMHETGLEQVPNPSEVFLRERVKNCTGSTIIPTLEGSRSILVEVQALVAPSAFTTPSRKASGIDQNRLSLLLAVLEKRMGYHLHNLDVFVSLTGGWKIREPGIDLGLLVAIASSFCNRPVDPKTAIVGEVGLSGEVRTVRRTENRIREAMHMGFDQIILPKGSIPKKVSKQITCIGVERVDEVISLLLDR